jgi:hypothetical protein
LYPLKKESYQPKNISLAKITRRIMFSSSSYIRAGKTSREKGIDFASR